MAEKIRCAVCNNMFEPCERCLKLSPIYGEVNQWRRVVCCPEHFAYHTSIIGYVRNKLSKEQAKTDLQTAIDKYGKVDFNDNVKSVVDEIMAENVDVSVKEIAVGHAKSEIKQDKTINHESVGNTVEYSEIEAVKKHTKKSK